MYYNKNTFFCPKTELTKTILTLPIHKKLKTGNRSKLGYINNLALKVLVLKDLFLATPKYIGSIIKKKRTNKKRKEFVRNIFYKACLNKNHFILFWIENIIYPKLFLQKSDLLYKQKESLMFLKKNIFYRKKKYQVEKRLQKRNFSFTFPIKILDFSSSLQFESILHSIANIQMHINMSAISKREAILFMKQYTILK